MRIRKKMKHVLVTACVLVSSMAFTLVAYAKEGEELTLNFDGKEMNWDGSVSTDESGVADLNLFETSYIGVNSETGEKIVAPGTSGETDVVINNTSNAELEYTAVLYTTDEIEGVDILYSAENGTEMEDISSLQDAVEDEAHIIGAYTGTLSGKEDTVLDIDWVWEYESGNDENDTLIGNTGDELTVYLLITGESEGETYTTSTTSVKTGDENNLFLWAEAGIAAACILTVVGVVGHRSRKKGA